MTKFSAPASADLPPVTVGLTTFNSERYVREAVESLLKQDYPNFTLHIYDNCSTDSTRSILKSFSMDSRLVIHENSNNFGAIRNFVQAFENADTEYFMWAGHDDRWESDFISKTVAYMEKHPEAVLCFPDLRFISPSGEPVYCYYYNRMNMAGLTLTERVIKTVAFTNWYCIYGLFRKSILGKAKIDINCPGPDVIILTQIAMLGEIHILPELLYHYRLVDKSTRTQMINMDSKNAAYEFSKPYTEIARNVLGAIRHSSLYSKQQAEIMIRTACTLILENNRWRELLLQEHPELEIAQKLQTGMPLTVKAAELLTTLIPVFFQPLNASQVFGSYGLNVPAVNISFETMAEGHEVNDMDSFIRVAVAYVGEKSVLLEKTTGPVILLAEYFDNVLNFVEAKQHKQALDYYWNFRNQFQDTPELEKLDNFIHKLEKEVRNRT
jgi:glycosyltransferase involved in cell wall biosynthesis